MKQRFDLKKKMAVLMILVMILTVCRTTVKVAAEDGPVPVVVPTDSVSVTFDLGDDRNQYKTKLDASGMEYEHGESYSFPLNHYFSIFFYDRDDNEYPPACIVILNENETIKEIIWSPETNAEKKSTHYEGSLPGSDKACNLIFKVLWTVEEYNYAFFDTTIGDNYVIEYDYTGQGTSTANGVSVDNHVAFKNMGKVKVASVTPASISFTVAPQAEAELEEIRIAGKEAPIYSSEGFIEDRGTNTGSTYTINLSEEDFDENKYAHITFKFTNDEPGGGEGPKNYRVRFDNSRIKVERNNPEGSLSNDTDYTYPDSGNITLTFTESESAPEDTEFYGIAVRENDAMSYIRKAALTDENKYTIEQSSFVNNIEIEVITWEMPFDNEAQINFSENNSTTEFTVTNTTVTPAREIKPEEIVGFETESQLSFNCSAEPYKVIIEPNDSEPFDLPAANINTVGFTYTPSTIAGFRMNIYWTQEEYDYNNCWTDVNSVMLEYSTTSHYTVTADKTSTDAAYDGMIRRLYLKASLPVSLTIQPEANYTIEKISLEDNQGGIITSDTYTQSTSDGIVTIALKAATFTNTDTIRINVDTTDNQGGGSGDGEPGGGETGGGGQGGGGSAPSNPTDYNGARTAIVAHEYAYYADITDNLSETEKETLQGYLKTEVWNEFFKAGRPYNGMFADEAALLASTTLGAISEDEDTATKCKYITYTITLHSGDNPVLAEGNIYILPSAKHFIVKTGSAYNLVDVANQSENDIIMRGDGDVKVFGNGTCTIGSLSLSSESAGGWHITQEHSGLSNDAVIGQLDCRLIVCSSVFNGAKITGSRNTAAWDFGNTNIYEVGSAMYPGFANVFYGNETVDIKPVVFTDGSSTKEITGVAVDTTNLSADAASITNTAGVYSITFNTGYDMIPLIINFKDSDTNAESTGYIIVNRVGLSIGVEQISDSNEFAIWHGTDHKVKYTTEDGDNGRCAVYATFYYAGSTSPTDRVSLFLTTQTTSGITRRINTTPITASGTMIESSGSIGKANQGTDMYYDDFLIWSGTETEYNNLDGIGIIAFVEGDGNTFGGVKVGSKKGVTWININ